MSSTLPREDQELENRLKDEVTRLGFNIGGYSHLELTRDMLIASNSGGGSNNTNSSSPATSAASLQQQRQAPQASPMKYSDDEHDKVFCVASDLPTSFVFKRALILAIKLHQATSLPIISYHDMRRLVQLVDPSRVVDAQWHFAVESDRLVPHLYLLYRTHAACSYMAKLLEKTDPDDESLKLPNKKRRRLSTLIVDTVASAALWVIGGPLDPAIESSSSPSV
jgi:hypothetical protein